MHFHWSHCLVKKKILLTITGFWKVEEVKELIPEKDGNVRAAVVKVANNSCHPSHLRRVVQHLVPIEVRRGRNLHLLVKPNQRIRLRGQDA